MNDISKMIAQLCPDGVEYRKLGEVVETTNSIKWKEQQPGKEYVYIDLASVDVRTHRIISELTVITKDNAPSRAQQIVKTGDVLFGTTRPTLMRYCQIPNELDGSICSTGYCIFRANENIVLARWIFHVVSANVFYDYVEKNQQGAGYPSISDSMLKKMLIPVPPLSVQRMIVEVLDKFTELEAELEARRRQYEHYRERLLTFRREGGGVRWMRLNDVFELRNGYTPSKNNNEFWDGGSIPWLRMEDIRENGRLLSDSIQHITEKAIKGKGLFKAGSFIMATTATIGEHAMLIVDSLANQRFTNLEIRKSLVSELNAKFCFHYMYVIGEWCKKNVNAGGFASVDMAKFKNYMFPVPPLSEQARIVGILDRFEALTTDLQSGLPAEIAARRRQYEYYRERLLTFRRKGAQGSDVRREEREHGREV